jgi:hypothetical protein
VRQGEIRQRLDIGASLPSQHVLVLSGEHYLAAPTGRVIVCRVLPGVVPEDFAGFHRISYSVEDVTTIGVAVPELIAWLPRSGLSEPVGLVADMRPVLNVVNALFI